MIPRSRILVSFQNPPGPFLKKETKLFLCLFDLNFDFDSKYDKIVFFCLGREARMQGKHVITRQLPYHGLRRATQQFAFQVLLYCVLWLLAIWTFMKGKNMYNPFLNQGLQNHSPVERHWYPYNYFGGVPFFRCQTFETIFLSFSEFYSLPS